MLYQLSYMPNRIQHEASCIGGGRLTPGVKDTPIVGPVNPSLVRKWAIPVSGAPVTMVCIG